MESVLLDVASNPATVTRTGDASGPLAAGTHLKVETNPDGSELLDYEVPVGKVANVRITVFVVETNA